MVPTSFYPLRHRIGLVIQTIRKSVAAQHDISDSVLPGKTDISMDLQRSAPGGGRRVGQAIASDRFPEIIRIGK